MFVGEVKVVEVVKGNGYVYLLENYRIRRRSMNDPSIQTIYTRTEGKLKLVIVYVNSCVSIA